MQAEDKICLRAHHGLCLLNFVGEGYSSDFSKNMMEIKNHLCENPKIKIKIKSGVDDICKKCPNNKDNICTSNLPEKFDKKVLDNLNLNFKDEISWEDFKKMTLVLNKTKIGEICKGCKWLDFCKKIIKENL